FSFLFNWTDARWDRGLRDRMFQFAPVYVSAESMRWWLGRECFASQKCILATREEGRREEEEDEEDEAGLEEYFDHGKAHPSEEPDERSESQQWKGRNAWYDEHVPPFALWVAGNDELVDGRRLLRRFERGREPHVKIVHTKIIEEYEHLDVIWAMDMIEKVGREVKQVLWKTAPVEAKEFCRIPEGCESIDSGIEPALEYIPWKNHPMILLAPVPTVKGFRPGVLSLYFVPDSFAGGASEKEKVRRSMAERKKSMAEDQVTSVFTAGDVPVYERKYTADEEVLAALGYKPEFKREFSLWTSFCVSFAVLGLLPSFASTLYYVSTCKRSDPRRERRNKTDCCFGQGMGYAGTPGMTWGWLIAMIFIQCVAMSMAELCSAMPTSGGLYYAAAVLAPPGWGPLAACQLLEITGAPSVDYGMASMILAAASITNPTFVPQNYQVFLLTMFIMVIQSFISSMPTKWIANFNSVGSTFNIIALFIVLIMIPAANTRADQGMPKFKPANEVWGNFYEGTSFPNGMAMLMSFVAVIWTMSGYDAPFHLSEECSNANIASPRAIVLTSGVGGLFGWLLQLVVAYTVVDIDAALESDLGQPYAAYLLQVLPQNVTLAILALTIMCAFSMGQGCMV
ncbi:MAG: hypothetical protein Q9180_006085, partial [Flavoplaca navasiana]